ncbi:MAG: hypothetical protein Q4B64_01825 [Spirochaetales bacterium]|nr:hypothetical protein [Spirochaetales bacterium]
MNEESGFTTPLAMAVIFSLSLASMIFFMFVASVNKKINSYKRAVESRKEMEYVTRRIEEKLQDLKLEASDIDERCVSFLISDACDYNYTIRDVSTGINRNFASEEFIKNKAIGEYINFHEESLVDYGWLNPKISEKAVVEEVVNDFGNGKTYPLLNSFPPFNVFFMDSDFLRAVFEYAGLKEVEKKANMVLENLNADTTVNEIATLIGVEEKHQLFDLIGLKTSFWQVEFESDACRCTAIYAAVPKKEQQREIERYMLVDRKIFPKGGYL